MSQEALEHIVIDAGALIKGHGFEFHKFGKKFWSVQECINEVRDSKSRMLLEALPFEIHLRDPKKESMQVVSAFTRRTGDFAALSLTDLKLMALTYELDVEEMGGDAHIRTEPVRLQSHTKKVAGTVQPPTKSKAKAATQAMDADGFISVGSSNGPDACCAGGDAAPSSSSSSSYSSVSPGQHVHRHPEMAMENAVTSSNNEAVESEGVDVIETESGEAAADVLASRLKVHVHFNEEDADASAALPVDFSLDGTEFPSLEADAIGVDGGSGGKDGQGGTTGPDVLASASVFSWSSVAAKPANTDSRPDPARKGQTKVIGRNPAVVESIDEQRLAVDQGSLGTVVGAAAAATAATRDKASTSKILSGQTGQAITAEDFGDDGQGWISPSTIKKCKANGDGMFGSGRSLRKDNGNGKQSKREMVACMTNDFSMQNSLIQMNLHIMSLDGLIVRRAKQFVLRCNGCFTVQYDVDKLFCSKCGGSYLSRVSASVDSRTGEMRLHLRKDYKHDLRSMNHSLPAPGRQGKYEGELLLREDQLMGGAWRQKVVKVSKDVRSAFGDDIISDLGMHVNKGTSIKVGLGRNPNANRGRERRGKKKR